MNAMKAADPESTGAALMSVFHQLFAGNSGSGTFRSALRVAPANAGPNNSSNKTEKAFRTARSIATPSRVRCDPSHGGSKERGTRVGGVRLTAGPSAYNGPMLARLCSVLSALLLIASTAAALDPTRLASQSLLDAWQTEQGLPQSSVGAVQRTRDGYLWAGTEEGLVRFDGVRFKVFDRGNTAELPHSNVNALLEDRRGRLWIGTSRGLARYERGRFARIAAPAQLRIATVFEDRSSGLWVGTLGDGLYRVDGDRIVAALGTIPGKRIRAIAEDRTGELWLATEAGLTAVKAARTFTKADGLADDNLFALWPEGDALWIGSDAGVQSKSGATFTTVAPPAGISLSLVRAMWRDRAGGLWIGTQGNGLVRIRGAHIDARTRASGLPSNVVVALHEDIEGSLWLGTSGGGLVRLRDGKVATFSTAEGVPADMVFSVFEDRERAIWFGTRGGGVSRWKDGAMQSWSTKDGLTSDDVVSVGQTSDGTLWIGTYGGGLLRRQNERWIPLRKRDGLASDEIYALLGARDGSLWIGTGGAGLDHLVDGTLTHLDEATGLPGGYVQALLEDRHGALWVGTNEGLSRIQNGRIKTWTTREGLPDPSVISLAEDGDAIWIGTSGAGMARFAGEKFAVVTTRQGLHHDMIASILDDGHGRFWISSNHGIFSVDKQELHAVASGRRARLSSNVYGSADGMKSAECYGGSFPSGWRGSDGRLWFATIRGAVVVDPQQLHTNRFAPPVVIESIVADGRDVGTRTTLEADTRRLEITYSGLSLADPSRVTFRYKLEGFDPQWIDAGNARVAHYTNVPHGRFRFLVMARNNDGVWNSQSAARSFEVAPHFYETWSFRIVALIALAALIFGVHRLRVWRLHERQRELEAVVTTRTRELHDANRELDRLARIDGLTRIANRRAFDEALEKSFADARRHGGSVALVLGDIDQFKKFNDSQGHQAGDETLQSVAAALAGVLRRETDLAARYGGEELVMLLPGTDAEQATHIAHSTVECVRALSIPHPASDVAPHVTISLGVAAMRPADGGHPEDLIALADAALYRAKTAGRDRWMV